jgi:adenylylsulfate kinase
MIIAMMGLPGSGKSYLAAALAPLVNGTILNKDTLRAALFSPEQIEYSARQDDFVVDVMLQVAVFLAEPQPARNIFLDGRTFAKKAQVDHLLGYSQQHGWDLRIIACTCADEIVRARLERDAGVHVAGNRNFDLYLRLKAEADPLQAPHLLVDTGEAFERCVQRCLDYLRDSSGSAQD